MATNRLPTPELCENPTPSGFIKHSKRGEAACANCKKARNEHLREVRKNRVGGVRPRRENGERPPCGTSDGYFFHHRNKEPSCEPCNEARRAYQRELYRRSHTVKNTVTISNTLFRDLYLNVDPTMASEVMAKADNELGREVVDKTIEAADKIG